MDRPELVAAHLARNLVALRHVRNLTQGALAKAAGVPRSTISNLESSSGNPSLTVLVKVASTLGVPLDELLASPRAKVRKWSRAELASQSGGRGVTIRSLIPERVPEELLNVMEFAPGASMRGTASARHARVLHVPGGRSHDLRRWRSLRLGRRRRAGIPGQRATFVQERGRQPGGTRRVGCHPRQVWSMKRVGLKLLRRDARMARAQDALERPDLQGES